MTGGLGQRQDLEVEEADVEPILVAQRSGARALDIAKAERALAGCAHDPLLVETPSAPLVALGGLARVAESRRPLQITGALLAAEDSQRVPSSPRRRAPLAAQRGLPDRG